MNKKMLMLMAGGKGEKGRRVGVEYEDWGPKDNYPMIEPYGGGYGTYNRVHPMENKFRDRRGREHYDNGRYAPMSIIGEKPRYYPQYPDEQYGFESGREDPYMDRSRYHPIYEEEGGSQRMNPIGFASDMGGSDATMPQYQEIERMQGQRPMRGYAGSEYMPRFDRQTAEEWMSSLKNEDGTRGPHWTLDQAKQVMAQKETGGSPLEFWVTLNMMYSDYCKVAKKLGVNTVEFYTCMAEAFLNDKDAVGESGAEKLAAYYAHVVKH